MAVQFMITAKAGYTRGSSWVVDRKALTIGRSYRCDIVVDDGTVSRQHCRVLKVLDGVRLEDLGSRNPAMVDGIPEKDVVLQVGDEFSVGRAVFLVTAVAAAGNGQENKQRDSETISINLDEIGLDGIEQHGAWPGSSADYVLLFRFCRVCSHLKTRSALANQLQEVLAGRFGPCTTRFLEEVDGDWGIKDTLGEDFECAIQVETLEKSQEERKAFSCTIATEDLEARYVFLAPIFHGDSALGCCVVVMSSLGTGGDRETVLTLFSALCELVGPYVHAAKQHEELVELNRRLSDAEASEKMPLVGRSPALVALRTMVYEAARTPLNVLITGETGTGKELIARAVHRNSARKEKPYVIVNCAAIPPDLFESELFGYVRGAFTGAQGSRSGLLAMADRGILFLDEVGDLSPENQARILRVLEQGTYRRVGASEEMHVDIRFVAATNRSVEDEGFRSDLYHRLAGFAVHAAPLRERAGDVPVLAQYFMDLMATEDERLLHVLSEEASTVLSEYHWPGNIRQLRNTIERIAHRTTTPLISAEDIWRDGHIRQLSKSDDGPLVTLAELEREHILKVLRNCNGNRAKSARILGISRSTLYLKLAQCGVDE